MSLRFTFGIAVAGIFVLALGQPATAQKQGQSADATAPAPALSAEKVAQYLRDAKTKGNYGFQNVLSRTLSDPVGIVRGTGQTPMDKKQVLDNGVSDLEALKKAMPDFRNEIDDVSIQGDDVSMAYSWHGTMSDGSVLLAHKRAVLTVKDGKVVALAISYEDESPEAKTIISAAFKAWKTAKPDTASSPSQQSK
jgi:hypothetical protein